MKSYLATTGILFLFLVVVHVIRVTSERVLIRDPWYWLITVLSLVLALWAFRLLQKSLRSGG